jgi:hypothetical protein
MVHIARWYHDWYVHDVRTYYCITTYLDVWSSTNLPDFVHVYRIPDDYKQSTQTSTNYAIYLRSFAILAQRAWSFFATKITKILKDLYGKNIGYVCTVYLFKSFV